MAWTRRSASGMGFVAGTPCVPVRSRALPGAAGTSTGVRWCGPPLAPSLSSALRGRPLRPTTRVSSSGRTHRPAVETRAIFVWSGSSPMFGDEDPDDQDDVSNNGDDHSTDADGLGDPGFSVDDGLFGSASGSGGGANSFGGGLGGFGGGGGPNSRTGNAGGFGGASSGDLSTPGLGDSHAGGYVSSNIFGSATVTDGSSSGNKLYDALRAYSKGPDDLDRMRSDASANAADAFKRTVLAIVGALPSESYDVTITSDRSGLSNLMQSSFCTGYALRNAEYRMMLNDALSPAPSTPSSSTKSTPSSSSSRSGASSSPRRGRSSGSSNKKPTTSSSNELNCRTGDQSPSSEPEYMRGVPFRGNIDSSGLSGYVKWWDTELGSKQEMSASDYVSKLEDENALLRDRLAASQGHDGQGGNRLLEFMKTLSSDKILALQQGISPPSEDAFRQMVKSVLGDLDSSKVQTTYSTSRDYMAQITYWCLLVGYTVRNLEKRNEMQALYEGTESLDDSLSSMEAPPPQAPSSSPSSSPPSPSSS